MRVFPESNLSRVGNRDFTRTTGMRTVGEMVNQFGFQVDDLSGLRNQVIGMQATSRIQRCISGTDLVDKSQGMQITPIRSVGATNDRTSVGQ